jgi:hypothetical protein
MKLIKLDSSDVKALDNISKTHPPNRFVYPAFGVSSFPLLVFLQLLILYSRSTSVSPISNRRCSTFDEPDDAGKLEDVSRASDEGYSRNHTMIAAIIPGHLSAISPSFYLIFVPCRVALPPFHPSTIQSLISLPTISKTSFNSSFLLTNNKTSLTSTTFLPPCLVNCSKSAPEVKICDQTSSVSAAMNSGVQFRSWSKEIASIMVPMLYQREDLRRYGWWSVRVVV